MSMDKIPAAKGLPFPPGDDRPDEQYDMRIARDGTWFYHGSPIGRIALVKLFATVLRRDDDGVFWLITPAERGRITVEDVPFVAVEVQAKGEGEARTLSFRTNLDEWVTAGPEHPIRVVQGAAGGAELSDAPTPYILIRDRLARMTGPPQGTHRRFHPRRPSWTLAPITRRTLAREPRRDRRRWEKG